MNNYQNLRCKYYAGNLDGYLKNFVWIVEAMFNDEELLSYQNGAFKVIMYYYKEGLSYKQIAKKMNINISTVYKYRNQVLNKIAEVFNISVTS